MIDWDTMNKNARAALLELGVDIDVTAQLSMQSTAIQQMVSIARALSRNTKLLIMDEATSSLDTGEVKVLFDVVKGLNRRGFPPFCNPQNGRDLPGLRCGHDL